MKKILNYLIISLLFIPTVALAGVVDVDEKVTVMKDYNSSHLSVGQTVKSDSKIDGINTIIGRDIRHDGTSDYLVSIGESVSVDGTVENDLFVLGQDITIGSDAIIKRDLYMAGRDIKVLSNINGNIMAAGETLDLRGATITGNVYSYTGKLLLDSKTNINGKLTYYEDTKVSGLDRAKVSKTKIVAPVATKEQSKKDQIAYQIMVFINGVLASFVVLAILLYFGKDFRKKMNNMKLDVRRVFRFCIRGLIILLLVPFICLFGVFTGILTPASLILMVLYFIALYISTLVVSYKVGLVLGDKLKIKSDYAAAFIGIIVVYILKVIPVVGSFVSTIAILAGLGIIYDYVTTKKI